MFEVDKSLACNAPFENQSGWATFDGPTADAASQYPARGGGAGPNYFFYEPKMQ
jgi:hypothetical protein